MPHQVVSEAVDAVLFRPDQDAVDHEPLHHCPLRRGVVHARRALVSAALGASVVVARHTLVQDAGRPLWATAEGVIVHDVHHHSQALGVQRRNHAAMLEDARPAIGVRRVRALGHVEEYRVVAPIEAVDICDLRRQLLRQLGVRRLALRDGRLAPVLRALWHRSKVIVRQQLHVSEAGRSQAAQVFIPTRTLFLEGHILAANVLGHQVVRGAEVADVQLVHRGTPAILEGRRRMCLPPRRRIAAGGDLAPRRQVPRKRAARIRRARGRVWVWNLHGDHLAHLGMIGLDPICVVPPPPSPRASQLPSTELRALHGQCLQRRTPRSVEEDHRDFLCRG
mmetsp:Transcript_23047/g.64862  ORF Transcript_23047/g.64862 Transcript_23047/m.64862 type:complete len:336 (-) Transcript_23047:882-1889(-)